LAQKKLWAGYASVIDTFCLSRTKSVT